MRREIVVSTFLLNISKELVKLYGEPIVEEENEVQEVNVEIQDQEIKATEEKTVDKTSRRYQILREMFGDNEEKINELY